MCSSSFFASCGKRKYNPVRSLQRFGISRASQNAFLGHRRDLAAGHQAASRCGHSDAFRCFSQPRHKHDIRPDSFFCGFGFGLRDLLFTQVYDVMMLCFFRAGIVVKIPPASWAILRVWSRIQTHFYSMPHRLACYGWSRRIRLAPELPSQIVIAHVDRRMHIRAYGHTYMVGAMPELPWYKRRKCINNSQGSRLDRSCGSVADPTLL